MSNGVRLQDSCLGKFSRTERIHGGCFELGGRCNVFKEGGVLVFESCSPWKLSFWGIMVLRVLVSRVSKTTWTKQS